MSRLNKANKRKAIRAEKITAYNRGFRHGRENYHPYNDPIRYNVNQRLEGVALYFNKGWDDGFFK